MVEIWGTHALEELSLRHARGWIVEDAEGRRYTDLVSGVWCNVLGAAHPRWVDAVQRQAAKLVHVGQSFLTDEMRRGLDALGTILPPALNRGVFLNTGSEAVELALKMAFAATGHQGVGVVEWGYYGGTSLALSLSGVGRRMGYLPPPPDVLVLPAPTCHRCPVGQIPDNCGAACLASLAEAEKGRYAAVLYEPVLSGAGVLVPPRGYGARIVDLAHRCGALIIAEEVTTGMGRTGRWFAFEHDDIVPDILVVGKILGAGLPVAAVVTTADVETSCRGTLKHVQSHQNDPFSGALAATVIDILREEGLVEAAAEKGAFLLEGLEALYRRHPSIATVRGRGLLVGVELVPERAPKGPELREALRKRGFLVDYQLHTATMRLFPPYVTPREEFARFLDALDEVLAAMDA